MFVLEPALLMIDTNILEVTCILLCGIIGMIAIGAGMIWYWYTSLHWVERIISTIAGLLLIYPGLYTDAFGLVIFVTMLIMQVAKEKRQNAEREAVAS